MNDYTTEELIEQIKDRALLELMLSFVDNESDKKQLLRFVEVFRNHGVGVETAIQILNDLSKFTKGE